MDVSRAIHFLGELGLATSLTQISGVYDDGRSFIAVALKSRLRYFCCYSKSEWKSKFDLAKDDINQRQHGLSLAAAGLMDFGSALLKTDDRKLYGEARYIAYGTIGARLYCLVFTMRGDTLRAISLRKANSREVRDYEEEI